MSFREMGRLIALGGVRVCYSSSVTNRLLSWFGHFRFRGALFKLSAPHVSRISDASHLQVVIIAMTPHMSRAFPC